MLKLDIDLDNPLTPDRQLVEQIQSEIYNGTLNIGELLPSLSQISRQLSVSIDIVENAYNYLLSKKYLKMVVCAQGKKYYFVNTKGRTEISKRIFSLIAKITGNPAGQKLLEISVNYIQFLRGIGSGGDPKISGECAVFQFIDTDYDSPLVVFDVGAHHGTYVDMIYPYIKKSKYEVHCFEPGKTTCNILRAHVYDDDKIIVNNQALGKCPGKGDLFYDDAGSGRASLTKLDLQHQNIYFNCSESVAINSVDNYSTQNSIEFIHLLKMDVEGHEMQTLLGAAKMLSDNRIGVVTFELGRSNVDTKTLFKDYYYFFKQYSMKIFRITPSAYVVPIGNYNERYEQFLTSNFIAVHENNYPAHQL